MNKIYIDPGNTELNPDWNLVELLLDIRKLQIRLLEALGTPRVKGSKVARASAAMEIVGMKPSTFHARQNPRDLASYDPTFPRSFKLGSSGRTSVWYVHELEEWLEAQSSKRTN